MTMPRYVAQPTWVPGPRYSTGAVGAGIVMWIVAMAVGCAHAAFGVVVSLVRIIVGTSGNDISSAVLGGGMANAFLRIVLGFSWLAATIVPMWSLPKLKQRSETAPSCWEHYILSLLMSAFAVAAAIKFMGDHPVMIATACLAVGIPALLVGLSLRSRRLLPPPLPMPYPAAFGRLPQHPYAPWQAPMGQQSQQQPPTRRY